MSREEERYRVVQALKDNPERNKYRVAEDLGVSPTLVEQVRKELEAGFELDEAMAALRAGRDAPEVHCLECSCLGVDYRRRSGASAMKGRRPDLGIPRRCAGFMPGRGGA